MTDWKGVEFDLMIARSYALDAIDRLNKIELCLKDSQYGMDPGEMKDVLRDMQRRTARLLDDVNDLNLDLHVRIAEVLEESGEVPKEDDEEEGEE